jgi:hypothetical protein
MRHKLRFVIVSVLALATAGTAGFFGGLYAWRQLTATVTVSGASEPGCDLQRGACRARFPDGAEMVVSVAPLPIPLLKPVSVSVELLNMRAEAVEVDLSSPDMYMGYNRRPLRALDAQRFAGQTVLPACILERMRWTLRAIAHSGKTAHEATFVFETATNRARMPG